MITVLKFYDVKVKKSYETNEYEVTVKGHRTFAIAQSPYSSLKGYRLLKKGWVDGQPNIPSTAVSN